MSMLAEEGLARLSGVVETTVETPCGSYVGLQAVPTHTICAVDIVRSGGILLEAVRKVAPDCKTAKILIQRDEETALPKLFYDKLPPNMSSYSVVLCDPMLATGGSALMAIDVLKKAGVAEQNILFINVVSCPEGLKALAEKAPAVRVLTAAVDEGLDENKFIVPGLGDFGDRSAATAAARRCCLELLLLLLGAAAAALAPRHQVLPPPQILRLRRLFGGLLGH